MARKPVAVNKKRLTQTVVAQLQNEVIEDARHTFGNSLVKRACQRLDEARKVKHTWASTLEYLESKKKESRSALIAFQMFRMMAYLAYEEVHPREE